MTCEDLSELRGKNPSIIVALLGERAVDPLSKIRDDGVIRHQRGDNRFGLTIAIRTHAHHPTQDSSIANPFHRTPAGGRSCMV
jgi:hypothetical protein